MGIDINSYSYWKAALEAEGFKWIGPHDQMHFGITTCEGALWYGFWLTSMQITLPHQISAGSKSNRFSDCGTPTLPRRNTSIQMVSMVVTPGMPCCDRPRMDLPLDRSASRRVAPRPSLFESSTLHKSSYPPLKIGLGEEPLS